MQSRLKARFSENIYIEKYFWKLVSKQLGIACKENWPLNFSSVVYAQFAAHKENLHNSLKDDNK
jgi:hypothetical protein